MKKIILLFVTTFLSCWGIAQINVQIVTPQEAVQALVGPNVIVSNISYTGDSLQLGYYTGATGSFPIASGIILSTEGAQDIEIGSAGGFLTNNVNTEPDLLDVANSVPPLINQTFQVGGVFDVAILEFDFVATGPDLSFNYVFGSDEYLTYVNSSYNDVFSFFISGPGITGAYASPAGFPDGAMNIAGVPNSNPFLPITISSVNNVLNSSYYIDNPSIQDVQLNGYTVTLTATATLICGETYHMKLAIADGSDAALKSIVGFQEGSFEIQGSTIEALVDDPNLPVGEGVLVEGCVSGSLYLNPPSCASEGLEVELAFSGTAVNGVDYDLIPTNVTLADTTIIIPIIPHLDGINDEGTETLEIYMYYINSEGDLDTLSTFISIIDYVQPTVEVGTTYVCGGTATVSPIVQAGLPPYAYSWSDGTTATTHNYVEGDAGSYSVTITDYCQTQFSTDFNVVEPEPLVIPPFINNCFGTPTGDIARGGATPYELVFSEDSLSIDEYSFNAVFPGTYPVYLTDQCGTTGITVIYSVICDTRIPNVFTPNGDGKNDTFEIFGVQGFRGSSLQVFDRWGKEVLNDKDYKNDWAGQDLPDGVYYYIFVRKDGKINTGHVEKLGSK